MKAHSRLWPMIFAMALVALASGPNRAAGPWYVAPGGSDSDLCTSPETACATINGAIGKATSGDTIYVAYGTYTGTGDQVVLLDRDVTLSGGWADSFTVQTGASIVDGEGARRGITVNGGVTALIERFILQNGGSFSCGGILNEGVTTLNDCTVRDNTAEFGGGIRNDADAVMILNRSLIADNVANENGGGIVNLGNMVLNNCTVSGNRAGHDIGGILNDTSLTLNSSTITRNTAVTAGGILNGVWANTDLRNTVLAGNIGSTPDCVSEGAGTTSSSGYNLIGNTSGCNFTPGPGDLVNVDPLLGPLEGSPGYHRLLPDSPAINSGDPAGCTDHLGHPLAADQRGFPRLGRCDIGAFEAPPLIRSLKTANQLCLLPGSPLTYTITLSNVETFDVSKAYVSDTTPVSLAYTSGSLTASSGSFGHSEGVITWTGSINAGQAVTVTFGATVSWTLGSIVNSAVISGGGEILTRTAVVTVEPYETYLPTITRNYCMPLYTDDFDDPASGWPVADTTNVLYEYLNGEYRILVKNVNWGGGARPGLKVSDYIVAVDVRNVSGVYGSYGLIFGLADDWSERYLFEIYPDRTYAIWRHRSGAGWTYLAGGTSDYIYPDSYVNRLKIERNGWLIRAYANGHLLASVSDGSYTGSRHVGLMAFSYDWPNVDVRFDNFAVYPVTCGAYVTTLGEARQRVEGTAREANLAGYWENSQDHQGR